MEIMKFGGTVLNTVEGFSAMSAIINQHSDAPIGIVVSAFGRSTRELEQAAITAESGNERKALEQIQRIVNIHKSYAVTLLKNSDVLQGLLALLDESTEHLVGYIRGVAITGELTPRTLDSILSFGEYFAAHITRHYLKEQNINIGFADAARIIVTDDNHTVARVQEQATVHKFATLVKPLFETHQCVLMQGFVGHTVENEVTTMGKESSNLTAALFASSMEASVLTIWTDIDGVFTSDPKNISSAQPLPSLTYKQAYTAGIHGVKLLFPPMIRHARDHGTPIVIRSAFAESLQTSMEEADTHKKWEGTRIASQEQIFSSAFATNTSTCIISHVNNVRMYTYDAFAGKIHLSEVQKGSAHIPNMLFCAFRRDAACFLTYPSAVCDPFFAMDGMDEITESISFISVMGLQPGDTVTALHAVSEVVQGQFGGTDTEGIVRLVESGVQKGTLQMAVASSFTQEICQALHNVLV
jgi:aspartate kinase